MEGVIQAIIAGVFSLAGVWLAHYLQDRKAQRAGSSTTAAARVEGTTALARPQAPARPAAREASGDLPFVFYTHSGWWALLLTLIALSIGGAFFANWVLQYVLSIFSLSPPPIDRGWLALTLGGVLWGGAYALAGGLNADEPVDTLFGVLIPYASIFDATELGEVVFGLFTALPINFLVSWGAALGLGTLASTYLGASPAGVAYLVFGSLSVGSVLWYLMSDAAL